LDLLFYHQSQLQAFPQPLILPSSGHLLLPLMWLQALQILVHLWLEIRQLFNLSFDQFLLAPPQVLSHPFYPQFLEVLPQI